MSTTKSTDTEKTKKIKTVAVRFFENFILIFRLRSDGKWHMQPPGEHSERRLPKVHTSLYHARAATAGNRPQAAAEVCQRTAKQVAATLTSPNLTAPYMSNLHEHVANIVQPRK